MRFKIQILREKGARKVPICSTSRLYGDLMLEHRSLGERERTVPVLLCLNSTSPNSRELVEPRLVGLCAGVIRLIGWESQDSAWYAQEWHCEIVEV